MGTPPSQRRRTDCIIVATYPALYAKRVILAPSVNWARVRHIVAGISVLGARGARFEKGRRAGGEDSEACINAENKP